MIKIYKYTDFTNTAIEEFDTDTQLARFIPVSSGNMDYLELVAGSGIEVAEFVPPPPDAAGDGSLPWEIIPSGVEVTVPTFHQMAVHEQIMIEAGGILYVNGTLKLER